MTAAKAAARAEAKKAIAALGDAEKRRQSALITEQVLSRPEWLSASSVAMFLSLRDEPCTRQLLIAALKEGRTTFAPRVLRAQPPHMAMLRVRSVEEADALVKGALGAREPLPNAENALDDGGPDLVLVPGLAFVAADGRRLGRGGGYYDTWLRECRSARARSGRPPPFALALAFREALRDHLPCEEHDARVDAVIYVLDQSGA